MSVNSRNVIIIPNAICRFVLWQDGGANICLKLNQQDVSLGRQKELIMQCLSITDRRSQPSHDQYRRLIWTASRQQSTMNGSSGDLKKERKKKFLLGRGPHLVVPEWSVLIRSQHLKTLHQTWQPDDWASSERR